jgi:hypothetical protein
MREFVVTAAAVAALTLAATSGVQRAGASVTAAIPLQQQAASWHNPRIACGYLAADGLRTSPYRDYGGEGFCLASVVTARHLTFANEIGYAATGRLGRITSLEIVAQMYNFNQVEDRKTLERATRLARKLLNAALGTSAPAQAVAAFGAGKTGKWKAGATTIEVKREEHQLGRGFTITLLVTAD